MKDFFDNLKYKISYWMQGRYGNDELNLVLSVGFLVLWILSLITKKSFFYLIGLVLLVYSIYRALSRDHLKRSNERLKYLQIVDRIKRYPKLLRQQWDQRKTHAFFRCSQCGVTIRVPKGKGQIEITCPKCGNKFIKRT